MKTAKVLIEVTASVLPPEAQIDEETLHASGWTQMTATGWQKPRPDPAYTKVWAITSEEWEQAGEQDRAALLAERNGQAQGYAALLMLQPDLLNWVRVDWIWL